MIVRVTRAGPIGKTYNWQPVKVERTERECEFRIATSHPYQTGTDIFYPIRFPGVERISIYFHDQTQLNSDDFITIYKDETHTGFWGVDKEMRSPWPGSAGRDPLIIPTDKFVVHFHSHKAKTSKWGFELVAKAPFSAEVVDSLVRDTGRTRSACISALAEAFHDKERAKKTLESNPNLDEDVKGGDVEDAKKLPGLFENKDEGFPIKLNLQTSEVYLHGVGSLRELPASFAQIPDFETVFKTTDNSNFRCTIARTDRNRQVVIFNHTDPDTKDTRLYEIDMWQAPPTKQDTKSYFTLSLIHI